jgi:hypothetical protein
MLNKNENICLIDNVKICSESGRGIWKLSKYLKKTHGIELEEYILKYYYDGKIPKCKCGCGNNVKYHKGRYFEYYSTHRKGNEINNKKIQNASKVRNTLNYRLERLGLDINQIKYIYNQYITFSISLSDIEKKYSIDKRTLKKYWIELGVITDQENFNRITKKHKYYWTNKNDAHKKIIDPDLLLNIYLYLKENKYKIMKILVLMLLTIY